MTQLVSKILNEIQKQTRPFVEPPKRGDKMDEILYLFIHLLVILSIGFLFYFIWLSLSGKSSVSRLKSLDILLVIFVVGGLVNLIRTVRFRGRYKIFLSLCYFLFIYIFYKILTFIVLG